MQPLAVARDKFDAGIYAEGAHGHTYDWRVAPPSDANTRKCAPCYRVLPHVMALEKKYQSHAHFVVYLVLDESGQVLKSQPLINKSGVPWLEGIGYSIVLGHIAVDHDNPGHAPWTPETRAAMETKILASSILKDATIYFSKRGFRALFSLTQRVPLRIAEGTIAALYAQLQVEGFQPDMTGVRWTQRFATPNYRKAEKDERGRKAWKAHTPGLWQWGKPIDPPVPLFEGDRAIANKKPKEPKLPKGAKESAGSNPKRNTPKAREARSASTIPEIADLPPWMQTAAQTVGTAIRTHVTSGFHLLYLALSATAYHRGISAPLLRAFLYAVALAEGSHKPEQHAQNAATTLQRIGEGQSVTAGIALRKHWPQVADALDRALATGFLRRAHARKEALAVGVEWVDRDAIQDRLQEALRTAPAGVSLIQVTAGGGKTRAAQEIALERANQDQRTAFSVDKNKLAVQIRNDLQRMASHIDTRRLFGPASLLATDGTTVCKYGEAAAALAEGRQSIGASFCAVKVGRTTCEYRDGCRAREASEGARIASILLGSHALMGRLHEAAGDDGLMIIDEPPHLLDTEEFAHADFRALEASKHYFQDRYTTAMQPVVDAVRCWMAIVDLGDTHSPQDALVGACDMITPESLEEALKAAKIEETGTPSVDAAACAVASVAPKPDGSVRDQPPLTVNGELVTRMSARIAGSAGQASRLYHALYTAYTATTKVNFRVETDLLGNRTLRVTRPNAAFLTILQRPAPTVLMDANMELHRPVVEAVLGTKLDANRVLTLAVKDSPDAMIHRTILWSREANRRHFRLGPHVVWTHALVRAVEDGIDFAIASKATRTFVASYREIVQVLQWHLQPECRPAIEAAWTKAGRKLEELYALPYAITQRLKGYTGAWQFAHYGGLRGMNDAQDCQCYITLGDPWPDLGQLRHDALYLGLVDAEERIYQVAAAEVAQAHQRARDVWQTGTIHHLHIGTVVPADAAWATAEIQQRKPGPIARAAALSGPELLSLRRALGLSRNEAATRIGVSAAMLGRYEAGTVGLPPTLVSRVKLVYVAAPTEPADPAEPTPQDAPSPPP